LRQKTNFTHHFNHNARFKPSGKNKSFLKIRKSSLSSARSGPDEGRTRRHERWTGNAMDAVLPGAFEHDPEPKAAKRKVRSGFPTRSCSTETTQTNGGAADGEVVWFWRSDAGAKLVNALSVLRATVATKHGHREDHV
jgi:hypothetical protein